MFKLLYCKFIHDNMYKMLLELTAFLEDMTKHFGVFSFGSQCTYILYRL